MTLKHEGSPVNPEGRSFGVRADFVLGPTGVWLNRSIPLGAKALYQGLLWCAFEDGCKPDDPGGFRCRPDNARLEAFCSCSANSLTRHFAALDRLGLIRRDVSRGGPRAVVELLVGPKGEVLAAGTEGEELTKMVGCLRTYSPKQGVELTKMVGSTHQNRESNSPKLGVPPIRESSELSESKTKTPQPPDGGRSGGGDSSSTPGKAEDPGTEAKAVGQKAIAQAKALGVKHDTAGRIGVQARRAVEAGEAVALVLRVVASAARQLADGDRPGLVAKVWKETLEAEKLAGEDEPSAPAAATDGYRHVLVQNIRDAMATALSMWNDEVATRIDRGLSALGLDELEFLNEGWITQGNLRELFDLMQSPRLGFYFQQWAQVVLDERNPALRRDRSNLELFGFRRFDPETWQKSQPAPPPDRLEEAARKTFDTARVATECREDLPSQWSPEGRAILKKRREEAAKPAPGPYNEDEDDRNPIPINSNFADKPSLFADKPSVAPQPPAPPPPPTPLERAKANAERLVDFRRSGGVHIADVVPNLITQAATA